MTYSPGWAPVLPMIGTMTFGVSASATEMSGGAVPSSGSYESANAAVYMPLLLPFGLVVRRLWWVNGSTVSASYSIDCGIYADAGGIPGSKLISTGSTAQGTASEVQLVDVADTSLAPGRYWMAIACSSASATLLRSLSNSAWDAVLRFEETSALPLPATATPVESTSQNIYLCGFATTASP
jgi:hypothetical protein